MISLRTAALSGVTTVLAAYVLLLAPRAALAAEMTSAQRRAAEEYLAAVASGSVQAVAYAIHPAELDAFRARTLQTLRDEAKRGESLVRGRLFGAGMPLSEIERLTALNFFTTVAGRLPISGRRYEKVREIGTVPGPDGIAYLVVKGVQPKERGEVQVAEFVAVKPYGKDWKAKISDRIEAAIDDIANGRTQPPPPPPPASATATAGGPSGAPPAAVKNIPPELTELLNAAERSVSEGNCEDYYKEKMSRNFRRVMSKTALESLITNCRNNMGTREMLLSTLRIARDLEPKFEYEGNRAVYDLSGQGLPFDRFILEKIDKRWYIAE